MGHNRLEFFAENEHWYNGVRLSARQRYGASGWAYATNLTMEATEKGTYAAPFLTLEPASAQSLMDELWKCGFRPADGTGSAGQLKATQDHLEDMRSIAFKALEVT